ncbi:MAG: chromosomal replication initiator protein DnaA [Betaproteobacteria bacterium]|nr:chromosomal replication initiator protein DnaA [Betaproteobacteria bacterium]
MNAFWSSCLRQLEQELPPQQFNTWIKALRLEDGSDSNPSLKLIAPNRFVLQWVRERYLRRFEDLAKQFFAEPVQVSINLSENSEIAHLDVMSPVATSTQATLDATPAPIAAQTRPSLDAAYDKTRLNPTFTFDTLVTGRANDLARAAAYQVALNPGISYNPLFVYGGVGLGKTHLIHALGNEVYRQNPDKVIRYVHAEDYYADVVRAYQQKSFDVFKRYYRSLDLLLIDDIQFFNNKNRTQEEFFYAFNALIEAKKQIVITCDTYPKDITGLEDRLISRFDWGLTVAIEPPELEMRVAILKKKAEAERIEVNEDVAFLIAKNLRSNVRELEGALKKVLAFARFHGREINLEVAKEALKDLLGAHNRQITFESIQKTVAEYYKIKVSDMYSKKRTRIVARPRQVAMWLAKELTPASLPAIGEAFGGRDHTTVLHACRTISDLRLKDTLINHDLLVLTQVLKG